MAFEKGFDEEEEEKERRRRFEEPSSLFRRTRTFGTTVLRGWPRHGATSTVRKLEEVAGLDGLELPLEVGGLGEAAMAVDHQPAEAQQVLVQQEGDLVLRLEEGQVGDVLVGSLGQQRVRFILRGGERSKQRKTSRRRRRRRFCRRKT